MVFLTLTMHAYFFFIFLCWVWPSPYGLGWTQPVQPGHWPKLIIENRPLLRRSQKGND
jgi:hypothetical protein